MNISVFDLHCDTALTLLGEDLNQAGSLKKNAGHIDLERAGALAGYAQCFACFTTPYMEQWHGISPIVIFERELATIQREVDRNRDKIAIAYSPAQIRTNKEKGLMSAVLTLEGTAGISYDPELLEDLHSIGFRISSLGWNESNPLTGSWKTGEGLSDRGREYVKRCQELGILVDVSHISDRGFWDIINMTQKPIVATHSNARGVCGHGRNLTDDMFRAICESGGVAGYNACREFTGEAPNIDSICDHIFHFMELDPTGEHVALGGDLDGVEALPDGFEGVQSWPKLAGRLLERGLGEENLGKIFWGNALRMLEQA